MNRAASRVAAAAACGACMLNALAAGRPLTECLEASDFVGNAALSRDNGVSAQKFIARLQEDFALIQAFPQELRWFVHDSEDEVYLLGAARAVFETRCCRRTTGGCSSNRVSSAWQLRPKRDGKGPGCP